jgi:cholesterol oxidase
MIFGLIALAYFKRLRGQFWEELKLPPNFGTADSSINDLTPEGTLFGDDKPPVNYPPYNMQPKNYCERQGRCVLGCLPGARQTLNKQLMIAMWGTPPDDYPLIQPQIGEQFLQVRALAEVTSINPIKSESAAGYEVHYFQRSNENPSKTTGGLSVTADRVILAAGCIGTNELLLTCKQTLKTLQNLSDKLGYGFATNGDYFAFIEKTKDTVNLTRGPVQTSFAHFFSDDASRFHTIEDLGIPRVFSVLFGKGFLRKFAETGITKSLIVSIVVKQIQQLLQQVLRVIASFFQKPVPPEEFQSEDIPSRNVMGISGMGRDAAIGQFRLGGLGETTLRVSRTDHKSFDQDPIFAEIKKTIDRFAAKLTGNQAEHASAPLTVAAGARNPSNRTPTTIVGVAHPLGGCRIAKSAEEGVVDEYGRVFGYKNLYIADASIIPSSLGVNPSLTISAVALRVARRIVQEYGA